MSDGEAASGRKEPGTTSGAPYPPADPSSDGPQRPRRDVPTAPDGEAADDGPPTPPQHTIALEVDDDS